MSNKRALIFGFGSIGRRYAGLLAELRIPFGVFDPQASPRDGECLPPLGFHSVLPSLSNFNAALICSPNHLHVENAMLCAQNGLHLFIEKPLATETQFLIPLIELVKKRQLIQMVSCNFRFETGMRLVKSWVQEGRLGRISQVLAEFGYYLPNWRPTIDYRKNYSARREMGGGVILDRIHELDYLIHLFGDPISVSGISGKRSLLEIDVEDTADLLFKFKDGIQGNLHLDYLQMPYCCECKIIGEKGTLSWKFKPSRLEWFDLQGNLTILHQDLAPDVNQMYRDQLSYFFECLETGTQPMNSIAEAALTLEWSLKARAISQG